MDSPGLSTDPTYIMLGGIYNEMLKEMCPTQASQKLKELATNVDNKDLLIRVGADCIAELTMKILGYLGEADDYTQVFANCYAVMRALGKYPADCTLERLRVLPPFTLACMRNMMEFTNVESIDIMDEVFGSGAAEYVHPDMTRKVRARDLEIRRMFGLDEINNDDDEVYSDDDEWA